MMTTRKVWGALRTAGISKDEWHGPWVTMSDGSIEIRGGDINAIQRTLAKKCRVQRVPNPNGQDGLLIPAYEVEQ